MMIIEGTLCIHRPTLLPGNRSFFVSMIKVVDSTEHSL